MEVHNFCNFGVQETVAASHATTSSFRPNRARIKILQQSRQLSDDIHFGQSRENGLHPCVIQVPFHSLIIQLVVAVEDEDNEEIWLCDASPVMEQIHLTKDRMFRIVPEVTPYAWMLSRKTDCRNMQLPPYAGNLVFMLPVKDEKPSTHTITIKLCQGVSQCKVLDVVHFYIKSHEDKNLFAYQSGRTITEVEKPIPKIQMTGVLARQSGRAIRMHFQNLGDNGQYNQFLIDKRKLIERVDGVVKYQDLLLAVLLEEAIMQFGQNKMDDCMATCRGVCARATRLNSGNWPFLQTKAFYIMSAVYRQAKDFDLANEYMEYSTESLEPACLGEETAVNKYNMAALLAEKSAAVGITTEEAREVERLFEDVVRIWAHQQENGSMRCINRMNIRRISYHLKSSRPKFPDLNVTVSDEDIAKAGKAIKEVEEKLLPQCTRRFKANFLIGKTDYFIRRATRPGGDIREQERDLETAMNVLDEALQISRELKMEKEIEGINDRRRNIQDLIERGLLWLNQRPVQNHGARNEPCERDTDDFEDLLENMLLFETEQNRRREDQCSE
ncbi:uncharacterized protein LOC110051255 isoform X1 [Orbicella faveolata]|uniref:uncharacterized protein LOC110051255 isoform X1 n=2 Tax=Orbicella faveolata TaxID=48498 RepID=UPI0009E239BB|nr:uncharacterized protein LOC110051255 isoform X1 [Orbicella faveolata]